MKKQPLTATVLMSGGIDSAACAHRLLAQGLRVEGLFIDHKQAAAAREAFAVSALAKVLGMDVRHVDISGLRPSGAGELVGRNAFLIFSALFLTRGNSSLIALGLHAGTAYFDSSEDFLASIDRLVGEHTDGRVSVIAPFITWSKGAVFDYFVSSGLPLAATYSCEAGTDPVCGECASCRERIALGSAGQA
jgi:7-cyano-7-deazaguanine synthase